MYVTREAITDPRALQTIMLSMQRLMKIGIYYPSGHSTFENAVDHFRQNLTKVAGENPFIRFTIKDNHLYLQDIKLDTRYFFIQEFKETLASMAIRYLDIDRDILPSEVQTFIRSLLIYRAKFKSTKAFIQINLEDLPSTVRIGQAEYLSSDVKRENSLESVDPTQQTIEVFLESLDKQGLNIEQLNQCRQLLESVLLSPTLASNDQNHSPFITWSDVEHLILSYVEQGENEVDRATAKSQQDLNSLASILSSLSEQAHDESSIEAINLLISQVKKTTAGTVIPREKDSKKTVSNDRNKSLTVTEIENYVEKYTVPYIFERYLVRTHRCEILTITLRLLRYATPSLQAKYRVQLILREILTGPIQEVEWDTIVSGTHDLLKNQNREQLIVSLMMILDPLRRSEYYSPLCLLEQVSRKCNPVELDLLLPYMINELLVRGRQDDHEVFEKLCGMVLYRPSSDLKEIFPVLNKLDAFTEKNIAQNIFFSMPAKFYPIFALLIDSSVGKLIARRAFYAFTNTPPDWLIDALMPIFDFTNTLHLKFLYEYLKIGAHNAPTTKVRALAGLIVVKKLPELTEGNRRDLAIIRTIQAMPRLKDGKIRRVLESIASKKYLLVIPDWPPNCRKAARESLAILDKSARLKV